MNDDNELESTHFKDTKFRELVISCLADVSANQNVSKAEMAKHCHQWSKEGLPSGAVTELKPPELLDESIQKAIHRLCEILPSPDYYFDDLFRKYLFGASPSEERLRVLEQCGKEEPDLYADVGLQAKLHRLDKALLEGGHATFDDKTDLILDWSQISDELTTFSRYHNIGAYSCSSPSGVKETYRTLIEWVFISQFPQGESETVRIDKLLRLARLLHLSKPPEFCTLSCLGFLPPKPDSPYQSGYGFVYPLPENGDMVAPVEPRSLRELLDMAKFPIALDQKFMIARYLANSLFQLHSHGWLHKNICSDNIFFCGHVSKANEKNQARYTITNGPYVIGFHHGRPENEVFCSDVPSSGADLDALLYRHPAYNPGDNRFQKAYDCYGLAIIMIELAYWVPAKRFRRVKGNSLFGEQLLDGFDRKYSRGLAEGMGTAYMEAARACLDEAGITQAKSDPGGLAYFYSEVVERLNKCYVG